MNTNKITFVGSIVVILLIVSIPTIYKVIKNHHNNLYHVVEEKIINGAKKCYYEENCSETKIALKTLYEKNYLDKISNPVTKEYYNEESYVEYSNNVFKFVIVEE